MKDMGRWSTNLPRNVNEQQTQNKTKACVHGYSGTYYPYGFYTALPFLFPVTPKINVCVGLIIMESISNSTAQVVQ